MAGREIYRSCICCQGIFGEGNSGQDAVFPELADGDLQAAAEMFPHISDITASLGAALAAGVELDMAVLGHAQLGRGPVWQWGATASASVARMGNLWMVRESALQVPVREGEPAITQLWAGDQLVGLVSSAGLRLQHPTVTPVTAQRSRERDGRARDSRWLPQYIYLPKEKRGGLPSN